MRKLVLFGLLAGVFGLALALERFFSGRAALPAAKADEHRAVLQLGGGPPRSIPDAPPKDDPARGGTLAGSGRPNRAPDELGARPRPPEPTPTPTPHPAALAMPATKVHVVAKNETLSSIARQELGTSTRWKELARWNGISDPATLKEGMSLKLQAADEQAAPVKSPPANDAVRPTAPATDARTHRVAKGDTLSRIAARYLGDATRWREIQRLNAIADPSSLAEGATLKIPER